MGTKAQALAAARRRWGKDAFVRDSGRHTTEAQREAGRERYRDIAEQISAIRAEQKQIAKHFPATLKAARFVVDVNGDHPSIEQLRIALEKSERYEALAVEWRELEQEQRTLRMDDYRYSAGYVFRESAFPMAMQKEKADTLDELLAKIEQAREAVSA